MKTPESGEYWAHCDGPDGLVVLLVIYCSYTGMFEIPADGREARLIDGVLHKWRPLWLERIKRPEPKREPRKKHPLLDATVREIGENFGLAAATSGTDGISFLVASGDEALAFDKYLKRSGKIS